ncbi:MAG: nitronate monooxygenase, partial [Actinomycetota bacterium]
ALGADGVWTGSIWLTVAEADTPPAARDKLLQASSRDTVRSRAMTGKPARMLRTGWTDAWEATESPGTLPMPLQWMLTAEAQHRIFRYQPPELVGMPVGQIVGRMKDIRSSADVLLGMVEECATTLETLHKQLEA